MLLEQFDSESPAVINPDYFIERVENMPEVCVSCFSTLTFDRILKLFPDHEKIATTSDPGRVYTIYKVEYKDKEIALALMPTGSPNAAMMCDDIYQMGVKKLIVFGTCGALDKTIKDCSVIVPTSAIRDEGTSYHYLPVADEIEVNTKYVEEFTAILEEFGCNYTFGKTWTTDAMYRETVNRVENRVDMGAICVEMECSAIAAVASFREKDAFQFFYAPEVARNENWNQRSLENIGSIDDRVKTALLAFELAARIL